MRCKPYQPTYGRRSFCVTGADVPTTRLPRSPIAPWKQRNRASGWPIKNWRAFWRQSISNRLRRKRDENQSPDPGWINGIYLFDAGWFPARSHERPLDGLSNLPCQLGSARNVAAPDFEWFEGCVEFCKPINGNELCCGCSAVAKCARSAEYLAG